MRDVSYNKQPVILLLIYCGYAKHKTRIIYDNLFHLQLSSQAPLKCLHRSHENGNWVETASNSSPQKKDEYSKLFKAKNFFC